MIGLALFQPGHHVIHGVLEVVVVLPGLHAVYHIHKGIDVLVLGLALKDDIGHKRTVQKGLRLCPELVALLAVALGIGNQGIDEFQNIALRFQVGDGVIVHGFCKVHAVEHLDPIPLLL